MSKDTDKAKDFVTTLPEPKCLKSQSYTLQQKANERRQNKCKTWLDKHLAGSKDWCSEHKKMRHHIIFFFHLIWTILLVGRSCCCFCVPFVHTTWCVLRGVWDSLCLSLQTQLYLLHGATPGTKGQWKKTKKMPHCPQLCAHTRNCGQVETIRADYDHQTGGKHRQQEKK